MAAGFVARPENLDQGGNAIVAGVVDHLCAPSDAIEVSLRRCRGAARRGRLRCPIAHDRHRLQRKHVGIFVLGHLLGHGVVTGRQDPPIERVSQLDDPAAVEVMEGSSTDARPVVCGHGEGPNSVEWTEIDRQS